LDALKMARDWIGTISPNTVLSMKEDGTQDIFVNGNAVFARSWPYLYDICNSEGSVIKGKFGITMIPAGKSGKRSGVLGGWGIGINQNTKYPKQAVKFIEFLTAVDAQEYRAFNSGNAPTTKAFYENKKIMQDPRYSIIHEAIINGFNRPCVQSAPYYARVSRDFYMTIYFILNKKITPEEGLKKIAKDIHEYTGFPIENEKE